MKKQEVTFQIMKRSETTHEVYRITYGKSPQKHTTTIYELIGRVVLDEKKDSYFAETTAWDSQGHEYVRIERPYVVFQAALNAITDEEPKEKGLVS